MADDTLLVVRSVSSDATRVAATRTVRRRGSPFGDSYVMPLGAKMDPLADEGSYYHAFNPTPLTAITGTIIQAYDATKPDLILVNGDSATGVNPRRIYLDHITMILAVAPASGTAAYAYGFVDDKAAGRYTSGGSTINPVCGNILESKDATDTLYLGAITASAASANARQVCQALWRAQIPVVKDQITFRFGASNSDGTAGGVITSANNLVIPMPPVMVPPGSSFLLHFAFPSNASTAYTAEWAVGYYKR